jgi:hypothetical protein
MRIDDIEHPHPNAIHDFVCHGDPLRNRVRYVAPEPTALVEILIVFNINLHPGRVHLGFTRR